MKKNLFIIVDGEKMKKGEKWCYVADNIPKDFFPKDSESVVYYSNFHNKNAFIYTDDNFGFDYDEDIVTITSDKAPFGYVIGFPYKAVIGLFNDDEDIISIPDKVIKEVKKQAQRNEGLDLDYNIFD